MGQLWTLICCTARLEAFLTGLGSSPRLKLIIRLDGVVSIGKITYSNISSTCILLKPWRNTCRKLIKSGHEDTLGFLWISWWLIIQAILVIWCCYQQFNAKTPRHLSVPVSWTGLCHCTIGLAPYRYQRIQDRLTLNEVILLLRTTGKFQIMHPLTPVQEILKRQDQFELSNL